MASSPSSHAQFIRTPAFPAFLNQNGYVKAGQALKLIDILGSETAFRYLRQNKQNGIVVTASLDRTSFYNPIRRWEMMTLEANLTQVWDKSMEVQVRVHAEHIRTGEARDIATAYLVFVALDPDGRQTMPLPSYQPETGTEKALALAADHRKKHRAAEGRNAPFIPIEPVDKPVCIARVMTPDDANMHSNVFGGIILSIIDEAGSAAARRQVLDGPVVGVRQDRMSFIAPTYIGETVEACAIVNKTWRTSMEVQVEVDAINPNTNERRRVASSYLVYVHMGLHDAPADVPPFMPQTDLQRQRAERAEVRREIRHQEEKAIIDKT